MWLQKIAEIKIRNRFCVTEIRMNILRLYSTYVVYLWTETGKGKILCKSYKSCHHPKIWYGIFCVLLNFPNKKNLFFPKVDGLRKRHENDTVYMKFSLRHWFKSVSWKENKNKTFRPWDLAAATLSCAFENGAAAVSMHNLTLVYISFRPPVSQNASLFQLRWQKLFIAHLSGVIKEIYLSLHPYLQPKLINRPPISSQYSCELVLF